MKRDAIKIVFERRDLVETAPYYDGKRHGEDKQTIRYELKQLQNAIMIEDGKAKFRVGDMLSEEQAGSFLLSAVYSVTVKS